LVVLSCEPFTASVEFASQQALRHVRELGSVRRTAVGRRRAAQLDAGLDRIVVLHGVGARGRLTDCLQLADVDRIAVGGAGSQPGDLAENAAARIAHGDSTGRAPGGSDGRALRNAGTGGHVADHARAGGGRRPTAQRHPAVRAHCAAVADDEGIGGRQRIAVADDAASFATGGERVVIAEHARAIGGDIVVVAQ
jgi:hypothetical protein